MITCKTSNHIVIEHFPEVRKTFKMLSKAKPKEIIEYRLSRYACYLIVQNANPKKSAIALGQIYFAVQTGKMEITEAEYAKLPEDERRLYARINFTNKNELLKVTE